MKFEEQKFNGMIVKGYKISINTLPIMNTNLMTDPCAVWIGFLHQNITLRDLVSHFDHCGTIWQAKIMNTPKSAQPFAFLSFKTPKECTKALQLDNSSLLGVRMKVRIRRMQVPVHVPPPPPPASKKLAILDPVTQTQIETLVASLPPVHIANPDALPPSDST